MRIYASALFGYNYFDVCIFEYISPCTSNHQLCSQSKILDSKTTSSDVDVVNISLTDLPVSPFRDRNLTKGLLIEEGIQVVAESNLLSISQTRRSSHTDRNSRQFQEAEEGLHAMGDDNDANSEEDHGDDDVFAFEDDMPFVCGAPAEDSVALSSSPVVSHSGGAFSYNDRLAAPPMLESFSQESSDALGVYSNHFELYL